MLKYGVVSEVDGSKGLARVAFDAEDGLVSYWLQVTQSRTLEDRSYCMPDPGEHVACLMDEDIENGVILGAVYSGPDRVPPRSSDKAVRWEMRDGTTLEYDPEKSTLSVDCLGTLTIKALGTVTVQGAEDIKINAGASILIQAWDSLDIGISGPAVIHCADTATINGNAVNVNAETVLNLQAVDAINLSASAVSINASGAINLQSSAATINASGACSISSGAAVTVAAPMITLN